MFLPQYRGVTDGRTSNERTDSHKPVDDLASDCCCCHAVNASNDIPSNPANVTPHTRVSLFHATCRETGGGNSLHHQNCRIL